MKYGDIKPIVYGLLAWAIMLPLLILNYFAFGFFYNLIWTDVFFFGLLTIVVGYVAVWKLGNNKIVPYLSGIMRWIFVTFFVFIPFYEFYYPFTLMHIAELPIMIIAYVIAFKVMRF